MGVMRAQAAPRSFTAAATLQGVRATWTFWALGAVMLGAALVRMWGLGEKSLWFDEAYSLYVAQQPLAEIPRLLRLYDTHPPLYYLLLHGWMVLFGRSEVAVRSLTVVASLGLLLLTFLLARRLAGDRLAVLAALLLAFSPFQIMASQEARMYPFLGLFAAGASYALWQAVEGGGRRPWIVYVVLAVLALYTHHFAVLLLLAHGAYLIGIHRERAVVRTWAVCMGAVALAYAPWLPMLMIQFASARDWPIIRPPFGIKAVTDTMGLFSFGGGVFGMGTYFRRGDLGLEYRPALLLLFVLLVLAGLAGLGEKRRTFVLAYWLIPVGTIGVISLWWNLFYERYFSFVLPPFVILLAAGILFLVDAMPGRTKAGALLGVLLLLGAYYAPAFADYRRAPPAYDWRGAARYVTVKAARDDFILFVPAFARIPFEYYFAGGQKRSSLNPSTVLAGRGQVSFNTEVDIPRFARIARAHPRMWIVATIPIGYEARVRIAELLTPYFREVEGKQFGQVWTFSWESKTYKQPGDGR